MTADEALAAMSTVGARGAQWDAERYEADDGRVWVEACGPGRRIVLRYRDARRFSWAVVTPTHASCGDECDFSMSDALREFLA